MPTRSLVRTLVLEAALLVGTALAPSTARACTTYIPDLLASYPAPNAVDVPTNAAIFVYGRVAAAETLVLVDTAGVAAAFDRRNVYLRGQEIIPREELAANETYRLAAFGQADDPSPVQDILTFTTGSGPASVPERLDPPALDAWWIEYDTQSTCGISKGLCVSATPAPANTTLEILMGDQLYGTSLSSDPTLPVNNVTEGIAQDRCPQVRLRDIRGNRSEPSTDCGEPPPTYLLQPGVAIRYTCDNYESHLLANSDAGACTLALHPSNAKLPTFATALVALALLGIRRRRM